MAAYGSSGKRPRIGTNGNMDVYESVQPLNAVFDRSEALLRKGRVERKSYENFSLNADLVSQFSAEPRVAYFKKTSAHPKGTEPLVLPYLNGAPLAKFASDYEYVGFSIESGEFDPSSVTKVALSSEAHLMIRNTGNQLIQQGNTVFWVPPTDKEIAERKAAGLEKIEPLLLNTLHFAKYVAADALIPDRTPGKRLEGVTASNLGELMRRFQVGTAQTSADAGAYFDIILRRG